MAECETLMADVANHLEAGCRRAGELYVERFAAPPQWVAAAPGRVNIIGEHTDYNDGFVLPMAIERYVVVAAGPASRSAAAAGPPSARLYSTHFGQEAVIQLAGQMEPGPVTWASYVQGVVAELLKRGVRLDPFDAVIDSSVPLGGGLSSSAALEVATATLMEAISGRRLEPHEKALLSQQAEHRFAGVPCGIMDQFSSVFCQANHLMLLDCRSQEVEMVPLSDPQVTVVIINSNVRHELTGGEYAQRRAQCEEAAHILGVPSLRDATLELISAASGKLGPLLVRRARHVVSENERTLRAAQAVPAGDWQHMGELMYASHDSLRDDFEVSCPELDLLVELARKQPGVIGSRMTGGGFGGCTVSLVWSEHVREFVESIHTAYHRQSGIEPTTFTTRPAQGARIVMPSED